MNRRRFLSSIGAAFATVALTTRLAKTHLLPALISETEIVENDLDMDVIQQNYFADPNTAWYIRTEDIAGIKTYHRSPSEAWKRSLIRAQNRTDSDAFWGSNE